MTGIGSGWRPAASLEALQRRAALTARMRRFFSARGVLEVETPALSAHPVTDPHLASLATEVSVDGRPRQLFLQTSPEYAMKRLLAAGSGPIFQLARAFRDGERGRHHNPEFTVLEWYRPGWDHQQLMDEVDKLLSSILDLPPALRLTYASAFEAATGLDPHRTEDAELFEAAAADGLPIDQRTSRVDVTQFLFGSRAEPGFPEDRATLVFDFPVDQAALARVRPGDPLVAERFEAYLGTVELANGFHELTDPAEQRARFEADRTRRRELGLPDVALDEKLLASLESLPPCAGVALGFDRLVMLALGAERIDEVLAFPIDRA